MKNYAKNSQMCMFFSSESSNSNQFDSIFQNLLKDFIDFVFQFFFIFKKSKYFTKSQSWKFAKCLRFFRQNRHILINFTHFFKICLKRFHRFCKSKIFRLLSFQRRVQVEGGSCLQRWHRRDWPWPSKTLRIWPLQGFQVWSFGQTTNLKFHFLKLILNF